MEEKNEKWNNHEKGGTRPLPKFALPYYLLLSLESYYMLHYVKKIWQILPSIGI